MPPKVLDPHHPARCVKRALDVMERVSRIGVYEHVVIRPFSGTQFQKDLTNFRIQNIHWDFTILSPFGMRRDNHAA